MAEIHLIKEVQRLDFKEEWTASSRRKPLPSRSKLIGLKPVFDEDGLMRSDVRFSHAKHLSFDVRYIVISWLTKLIIKKYHEHGKRASGTNHTLAALSPHYWIISEREAIRESGRVCTECRRR